MDENWNKAYTMEYFNQYDSTMTNGEARIPICFCIDTSASMNFITNRPGDYRAVVGSDHRVDGSNAITVEPLPGKILHHRCEDLKRVLGLMLDKMKRNPIISNSAVISVITFNRFADCTLEFLDIKRINPIGVVNQIRVFNDENSNYTNASKGLRMALERLEQFKQMNGSAGNESYKPVLIFMSDGQPTDRKESSQLGDQIREMAEKGKIKVIPIAIGDMDDSWMRHLSKESRAYRMQFEDEFETVFNIITRRISYTAVVLPTDEDLHKEEEEEIRVETGVSSSQYGEETDIEDIMNNLFDYMNE